MKGVVAIVGRPNVGKSTLFNRLIEEKKAIVDDTPGVTRDRNYGVCEWTGKQFTVIDTGGYVHESSEVFDQAIRTQVKIALEEADVVLFMVDGRDGITPFDEEVAQLIRKQKKNNVLLVVNKIDSSNLFALVGEFYALGFHEVFSIAAASGSGTGDLLDAVLEKLPEEIELEDTSIPRIAFVGKPNVGKSSLINALLGYENNIVTEIAGTTRDSINTRYSAFGFDFYLVDTAGLRKKAKVHEDIEFYSTIRTIKAIDECDLAFVMLDATQGIESQDLKIIDLVSSRKKGLIILLNKWDLVEKTPTIDKEFRALIEERIAPLKHIPILLISATEKLRIHKALQTAVEVLQRKDYRVPTHKLNEVMLPYVQNTPPPAHRGQIIRIKFMTQTDGRCPTFAFYCNYPENVPTSYKRFLENKIRENWNFDGWPITIVMREKV